MSDRDFAAAVRMVESGSFEGNYATTGGIIRRARIVGAYGFAADDWESLASYAGIAGANWQDPMAQDRVAKRAFDELYRKYGDYRLVAAAWKGGEELADQLAANPKLFNEQSLSGLKAYVEEVMNHANTSYAANLPEDITGAPLADTGPVEGGPDQPFPSSTLDLTESVEGFQGPASNGEQYMRRVLTAMRNGQRQRAERTAGAEPGEEDENGLRNPIDEPTPEAAPEQEAE